jgi:iron(III) transport system ATP-binding protein
MATQSLGIRLEALSAVFRHERRGDVTAVDKLDLEIRPGEFLTLLGASGCGKTTTLRMIAGFQQPSSGRIRFGEQDVTDLPVNRRDIGFVFQNYALFPHLSVFENVAYGLRIKGLGHAEIARRAGEGLEQVGLSGFGERMITELSGGQQQRVALARAIAIRPRVLLFDEPLSNLDAKLRIQMRSEIARLQRELAITTVYVTHDQEEAMAISHRIAIMNGGRIAQIGTAEDLYQRPVSAFVADFLGGTNLVAGVVRESVSGHVVLDVQGTPWALETAATFQAGQRLEAVVRPEAIELARDGHGLRGEIEALVYLGARAEYLVRSGEQRFQVVVPNPVRSKIFQSGEAVVLRLPERDVELLAEPRQPAKPL